MSANTGLPNGVVVVSPPEGSPCPPKTLGLWRHYNCGGEAYGIGAGHPVDLKLLPLPNGGSMHKNVSSWVNNTDSNAKLISKNGTLTRILRAGDKLEEPKEHNDTVERVEWEL
ncbi:peptidase inhibitor family I36 protein [Streptomyces sp. NBC_01276]|uniref:peptidase inhibitor family I36 protein n=1 Tax=Streptomyces sp. NBC_01276 TaxID=2903808 RepID=UPI002F919B9C